MNITLFIKEKLNLLSMINSLAALAAMAAMEPQEKVNLKLLVRGTGKWRGRVDSINIFCSVEAPFPI